MNGKAAPSKYCKLRAQELSFSKVSDLSAKPHILLGEVQEEPGGGEERKEGKETEDIQSLKQRETLFLTQATKGCQTDSESFVTRTEVRNGHNSANHSGADSKIVAPLSPLQIRPIHVRRCKHAHTAPNSRILCENRFPHPLNWWLYRTATTGGERGGQDGVVVVRFFICSSQGTVIAFRPRYI